ncbi:hypothetical protein [Desulfomonile tiedjei]|uniref:Uncharacterized protein n=1 Tax=Desulfomonile tiedjei (strain ATCC 49306 / DSM 6799 / DCB-1) TaxID=706587 RepID=I4CC31_DESTA|nr:hypothetical protein [Desulfomonile tiedjei]AFM27122.1 hypothetical protein Desti_4491 [Desulfomonile tiedjei DSM 6799]
MTARMIYILVFVCIFGFSLSAHALTCEECKELNKTKQSILQQLLKKDEELNAAFNKKNFSEVGEIRNKMLELRKKMIELRGTDEKCEEACRPDIVKGVECRKIIEDILRLEAVENTVDEAQVDALYRQLKTCNSEWEKLKKSD